MRYKPQPKYKTRPNPPRRYGIASAMYDRIQTHVLARQFEFASAEVQKLLKHERVCKLVFSTPCAANLLLTMLITASITGEIRWLHLEQTMLRWMTPESERGHALGMKLVQATHPIWFEGV